MSLLAAVEGSTDIPVVEALARSVGLELATAIDMRGKPELDKRLPGFNQGARGRPWLVLRDLDNDAPCAPAFCQQLGLVPAQWMVFTIAVREVEAWLMADSRSLSAFLHVPERRFPADPDAEEDPKRTLVNLARGSRRSRIVDAMVPAPRSVAPVGPLYQATVIEFARTHWSVERARSKSQSLRRAYEALRDLAERWDRFVGRRR